MSIRTAVSKGGLGSLRYRAGVGGPTGKVFFHFIKNIAYEHRAPDESLSDEYHSAP
jgi:hypothetical protein